MRHHTLNIVVCFSAKYLQCTSDNVTDEKVVIVDKNNIETVQEV